MQTNEIDPWEEKEIIIELIHAYIRHEWEEGCITA
jgi:hypothetical protein